MAQTVVNPIVSHPPPADLDVHELSLHVFALEAGRNIDEHRLKNIETQNLSARLMDIEDKFRTLEGKLNQIPIPSITVLQTDTGPSHSTEYMVSGKGYSPGTVVDISVSWNDMNNQTHSSVPTLVGGSYRVDGTGSFAATVSLAPLPTGRPQFSAVAPSILSASGSP